MFQKSIETVIAQGVKDLEALKKQVAATATEAQLKVQQCQSEVQTLVNLGKQVPEKVFDRYSNVLVGTFEEYADNPGPIYTDLRLGSGFTQLHGIMGDETLKRGKYRVILLLEKLA